MLTFVYILNGWLFYNGVDRVCGLASLEEKFALWICPLLDFGGVSQIATIPYVYKQAGSGMRSLPEDAICGEMYVKAEDLSPLYLFTTPGFTPMSGMRNARYCARNQPDPYTLFSLVPGRRFYM